MTAFFIEAMEDYLARSLAQRSRAETGAGAGAPRGGEKKTPRNPWRWNWEKPSELFMSAVLEGNATGDISGYPLVNVYITNWKDPPCY